MYRTSLLQPRDILSHLRAFGKCFFAIFQKKSDFSFLFSSFGLPAQILCRTHNFRKPLPVENRSHPFRMPQKAPVIQNPLPKGEVLEANLSVCFADSSPNRGALGRPGKPCCSLGLNWAQGSGPCSHWQRLRNYALPKSAGQAVVNRDSGARSFPIAENFARPARPPPTRQWLPYQGSWHREAMTERLYQGTLSSKNRLLSQARLRGCTPCRFTVPGRLSSMQPLRHLR